MEKVTRIYLILALFFCTAQYAHSQTELVSDGTFDNDTNTWYFADYAYFCTNGNYYSSPSFGCINFKQYNNIDGEIWQFIQWPSAATSGSLSFYYWITTYETTTTNANDVMDIRIVDYQTNNYIVLKTLSNLNSYGNYYNLTHTFTSSEIYTISHMANPCLSFYGTTDATYPTIFRIDNVSLLVNIASGAPPIAGFTVNNTTPCLNTAVKFIDQSADTPTSWYWDFGDGDTSSLQYPSHAYINTGLYTVELWVANNYGNDKTIKNNYIQVQDQNCGSKPTANFTAAPDTSIKAGQNVDFYDNSLNTPTSWSWKFYDGSNGGSGYQTATVQNPFNIVYTTANTKGYTVVLQASNDYGSDTRVKSNYIMVSSDAGIGNNQNSPTYSLKAYPNPVSDLLNMDFGDNLRDQSFLLRLYDNVGKIILSKDFPAQSGTYQFDMSNLPGGAYCVHITTASGNSITQNILKK